MEGLLLEGREQHKLVYILLSITPSPFQKGSLPRNRKVHSNEAIFLPKEQLCVNI